MPKIGRNDPCPCGSGKKYKKCCLKKDEALHHPPKSHHQRCVEAVNSLQTRAMFFVKKAGLSEELYPARLYYQAHLDLDESESESEENAHIAFMEWFVNDYVIPGPEKTVIELFWASNPKLPVEEMGILAGWQDRVISAYQITSVEQGTGVAVEELLLEQREYFITDRSLSRAVKPGDFLIARVFKAVDEWHVSGTASMGEKDLKKSFLAEVDRAHEEYRMDHPEADMRQFLKARGFVLPRLMTQAAKQSMPKVMTASGEELSFWQARYDLLDREEALSRLDQAPDFNRDEPEPDKFGEISFAWLEASESAELMKSIKGPKAPTNPLLSNTGGNGPFRLLGDIKITGERLLFNATGKQRFALGKQHLESLLGSTAKHRIDSMQSMESALAGRGSRNGMGGMTPPEKDPSIEMDPNDPKFAPLKSGESIHDALKNREFGSLDEANVFLQTAMADNNKKPQKEMGGLSPVQVRNLMDCDWEDPDGPIHLNRSLKVDDLKGSPLFHNARLLLHHASQEGGIKATGAGFLNTTFVCLMLAEGKWPDRWKAEFERRTKGRLREMDIRHLHSLRLICEWAGLIKKRNNSFQITRNGQKQLKDENACRLYRWLFVMQFQKLNLDLYDRQGLLSPEIQNGIEFSLYQIGQLSVGAWHNMADVGPKLLLPAVKRELTSREDHREWNEFQINAVSQDLGYRLIEPLEIFGLVETQDKEKPLFQLSTSTEFRRTGLWDKFILFNL